MAAYVLVQIDITDPIRYDEYKRLAGPTVTAFGGRYLARGGTTDVLEGDREAGRVVILEFPSAAQARQWWNSDEYRAPKAMRQAAARTEMILVEGV